MGRPRKEPVMNFLHKVETFNGEQIPEREEEEKSSFGANMSHEEKLQSVLNAVKVLPPNLMKNGRHVKENIQAINCFRVTDKMLDEVYANFTHEVY